MEDMICCWLHLPNEDKIFNSSVAAHYRLLPWATKQDQIELVQYARGCLSTRRMSLDDGDRTHSTPPLRALVTTPNSAFWSEFEHRPRPDPNIKTVCKYAFRIRM